MVVARPLAVVFVALCTLAVPAQALYEDLTFAVVLEDPADNVSLLDIQEVAVAETGAQEIVVRYKFDGTVPAQAAMDFDFFFTVDGKEWSTGIGGDGASAGNGNFNVPAAKSCALDGDLGYCVLDYTAFEGAIGALLTNTYAISYAGAAQDYGPGMGGYAPAALLAERGSDYTLVGCTKVDLASCPVSGATAGTVYGNLTTPRLVQSFNASANGTYVYNFTNNLTAAVLGYDVVGTGNLTILVQDAAQAVVLNQTFVGNGNGTVNQTTAAVGNWTYTLILVGFNGTVTLDLTAPAPMSTSSTSTAPASNTTTTTTEAADEETPATGLAVLAVSLLAVVGWRRKSP